MIFTFGYARGDWSRVMAIIAAGGALVDIRLIPRSRIAGLSRSSLAKRFGASYIHIRALGNANYRSSGPIWLADEPAGIAAVKELVDADRDVVLMCACADPAKCHRTMVARLLVERLGIEAGFEEVHPLQ